MKTQLTGTLHQERYDVSCHEQLCEPSLADNRMMFAIGNEDDPSQHHVYACGVEGRCDEEQNCGGGVSADGPVG
jgi:hypothetical protein